MSPEFNMEEALQERERSLLMRWVNIRLELKAEEATPTGKYYMEKGGMRWEMTTIDRMIVLSIPRFESLGIGEENKFVLEAFEGMLHRPLIQT